MADARERLEVAAAAVPLTSRGYALYAGVEMPPRFKVACGSEVATAVTREARQPPRFELVAGGLL